MKSKHKPKFHIDFSNETKKAIYELKIQDLKEQLENLKSNKKEYNYEDYRYKYVRLHTSLKEHTKTLDKLNKE